MTEQNPQRVALVTGGAIRVGRAITMALAAEGYDLMVSYRSSAGPAQQTQAAVQALGRQCETVRADLSEPSAAGLVIDAVRSRFGRLDLVVNSAANFDERALLEVDADAWDASMSVNVRAPHLIVRAAADLLKEARGSVVNIVDLSAFQPWTDYPAHSVSKASLAHLTRIQARALGRATAGRLASSAVARAGRDGSAAAGRHAGRRRPGSDLLRRGRLRHWPDPGRRRRADTRGSEG